MDAMSMLVTATMVLYVLSTLAYFGFLFLQKEPWQRVGLLLLGTGFACHTVMLGYAFIRFGSLPAHNLHQTLMLAGWAVTGFFLGFQYRFQLKVLGVFAAPLAAFMVIVSSRLPVEPAQVQAHFRSVWLIFHVVIILIGEAAFAMACGVGILYLVQEHAIKRKKRGFFYRRLPSLELLDSTGYACIVSGFTLLTIGLIGGFLYAKTVWGRFWSGDPKEVWSGIMWLFYAALLHERLAVGWRGRKSAIMSIIGFAVLLFTFLGVNIFLEGHHGEFTQW